MYIADVWPSPQNPSAYQRVLVADERSKKANEKRCSKTTYLSCATDQPMSDWGLSLSEFIGGLRLSMYQEEWLHFFLSLTIWILACRMSDAVLYRGRWKITICYNFNLTIEQQANWLRPFCRKKVYIVCYWRHLSVWWFWTCGIIEAVL